MCLENLNYFLPNDIFSFYYKDLDFHLRDCKTVLDVACGRNSPIKNCKEDFVSTGVDIFEPYLIESKEKGIHKDYIVADIMELEKVIPSKSFDAVIALDLIEHLEKEDGFKLIEMMTKIAKKKIIIFTPNGFQPQRAFDDNPWQEHKSGWYVEDFDALKFNSYGHGGLKILRGERSLLRFKPDFIWSRISYITQIIISPSSKYSYQLLAVKNLQNQAKG